MIKLLNYIAFSALIGWLFMDSVLMYDKVTYCEKQFPKVNRFYCSMSDLNVLSEIVKERDQ